MAVEERVQGVQGQRVELEVYVSGYPVPTQSNITWRRPDSSVITSDDPGVTFQNGGRQLILASATQAGMYECSVDISRSTEPASASVSIQLDINGEYTSMILIKQNHNVWLFLSILTVTHSYVNVVFRCSADPEDFI